jgi:hypothetical protein
MARITNLVKKETLAGIVKDVSGMERGHKEVKFQKLKRFRSGSSQWGG